MKLRLIVALVGALVLVVGSGGTASGTPTDLFFSEYVEGSSFNKALEVFNGTGASVDLAAGQYVVQIYFSERK